MNLVFPASENKFEVKSATENYSATIRQVKNEPTLGHYHYPDTW